MTSKFMESMTSAIPVSENLLISAFALAEKRLNGSDNYNVAQRITNETKAVRYEGSLNTILVSALSDTLPECSVMREYNKIDICAIHGDGVVVALESKGMVANSHSSDRNRISLDLHGIRTKLYPDPRARNSVQTDIADVAGKIPPGMNLPYRSADNTVSLRGIPITSPPDCSTASSIIVVICLKNSLIHASIAEEIEGAAKS